MFITFGATVMQDHWNFSLPRVRGVTALMLIVRRHFPRAAHYTAILRGNILPLETILPITSTTNFAGHFIPARLI